MRIAVLIRRPLPTLAAGILALGAVACGDRGPLPLEPDTALEARGGPASYPVVLLGNDRGPNGAATLEEAVALVAAGGTIRVFPGTWSATGVVIDRSVTLVGTGGEKPVIAVTPEEPEGKDMIRVMGSETRVALRGLVIDNTATSNAFGVVAEEAGSVELEDVDFRIGDESSGLLALGTAVTVKGGSFRGGRIGMDASAGPADVDGTSFGGHAWRALASFGGSTMNVAGSQFSDCGVYCIVAVGMQDARASLTVMDVDATDCGQVSCIYAINWVDAKVSGNRLSNRTPTGDRLATVHHVVFFWLTEGEISDNVIDGCGYGICVAASSSSNATIRGNDITAYGEDRTRIGIVVSDGFRGPDRGSTARVLENRVVGIGTNPATPEGHAIGCDDWCGTILVESWSEAEIRGNELANGNAGIQVVRGSSVTGRDNRISDVRTGVQVLDDGTEATLRFNDVTGYTGLALEETTDRASDLTCNWWGQPGGPAGVSTDQGAGLYTPWATSPVAGTGARSCSGS